MAYMFNTVQMTLKDYIAHYRNGDYSMPPWQRGQQQIWTEEYREELIQSILDGIDVPKLYHATYNNGEQVTSIIDGGHRTRTWNSFFQNKFGVRLSDDSDERVFYTVTPQETRNSRVMTTDEVNTLNNYKVTIVTYNDISEKEARRIFNRLNNAAPMAMPDIVNSWESELIDFLREMVNYEVPPSPCLRSRKTIEGHFAGLRSLPKPDNNECLYQLLSWFTIVNPFDDTDKSLEDEAIKYIEKGKNRNSATFKYLQIFDKKGTDLTQAAQDGFKLMIQDLITFLEENRDLSISSGDVNTYIYSQMWCDNFSKEKFKGFLQNVHHFKKLKTESEKMFKNGQGPGATAKQGQANTLDEQYDGDISSWIKSRAQNPSGEKSMKTRNEIIQKHCIEDESDQEDDDSTGSEEYVPGNGEPLPLVN